jgi:glutamate racemase
MKKPVCISTLRGPIGVFDSGVGGLTVLSALFRLMPREQFIYVGDTARVPYGTKSPEAVKRFTLEIARFLIKQKVKMIVAACNTVSAVALHELRRAVDVPVLGVIEPGARAALAATRHERIGVIGTEATVRSGAYEEAVHRLDPRVKVFSKACPLFVPLVEEGWLVHPVTYKIARAYLTPLLKNRIDTLVMGCTHYPLLKTVIAQIGRGVELIDSADEIAKAVRSRLLQDGLLSAGPLRTKEAVTDTCRYFSSDSTDKFRSLGEKFLGRRLKNVQRLKLEGV